MLPGARKYVHQSLVHTSPVNPNITSSLFFSLARGLHERSGFCPHVVPLRPRHRAVSRLQVLRHGLVGVQLSRRFASASLRLLGGGLRGHGAMKHQMRIFVFLRVLNIFNQNELARGGGRRSPPPPRWRRGDGGWCPSPIPATRTMTHRVDESPRRPSRPTATRSPWRRAGRGKSPSGWRRHLGHQSTPTPGHAGHRRRGRSGSRTTTTTMTMTTTTVARSDVMLMVRMLEARRQSVMLWRLLVTQLTTAASGSCRLKSAAAVDAEDVPVGHHADESSSLRSARVS